jgi:hypothetical protein
MPAEVLPTWRNGRSGVDGIQKRLDRVYVSDATLMHQPDIDRGWNSLLFPIMHLCSFNWILVTCL